MGTSSARASRGRSSRILSWILVMARAVLRDRDHVISRCSCSLSTSLFAFAFVLIVLVLLTLLRLTSATWLSCPAGPKPPSLSSYCTSPACARAPRRRGSWRTLRSKCLHRLGYIEGAATESTTTRSCATLPRPHRRPARGPKPESLQTRHPGGPRCFQIQAHALPAAQHSRLQLAGA